MAGPIAPAAERAGGNAFALDLTLSPGVGMIPRLLNVSQRPTQRGCNFGYQPSGLLGGAAAWLRWLANP